MFDFSAYQAKAMNKKVGVVSTARLTHATPAAVYARSVDRDYEAAVPEGCTEQVDIAQQVTRYKMLVDLSQALVKTDHGPCFRLLLPPLD